MFFDHYDGMNVLEAIGNYLQGVKKDVNATQRKKKPFEVTNLMFDLLKH